MPAHRRDGGGLGPGGFEAPDQAGEDLGLAAGIAAGQVSGHLAHVGMGDRAVERDAGGDVTVDQAAVIEVSCGRTYAADESDMHAVTVSYCPTRGNWLAAHADLRLSLSLKSSGPA